MNEQPPPRVCDRCNGRLMLDVKTGDRTCFTCGNIVYLQPIAPILAGKDRKPSHGGWNLG